METTRTAHVPPGAPANGGNYRVSLGTAAPVRLICRLRHHPNPWPCHKVELRPVAAHADLHTVFEAACEGLSITPEQLRQELIESGDIPDLTGGALHRMDRG